MENSAEALQPHSSRQEHLLPRDTPEESPREKDLADLEGEEIALLLVGRRMRKMTHWKRIKKPRSTILYRVRTEKSENFWWQNKEQGDDGCGGG